MLYSKFLSFLFYCKLTDSCVEFTVHEMLRLTPKVVIAASRQVTSRHDIVIHVIEQHRFSSENRSVENSRKMVFPKAVFDFQKVRITSETGWAKKENRREG